MTRVFHGWRMVAACVVTALFANALGLFGAGVYLHQLVEHKGWPTGLVSGAITLFYVVSALLLIPVGDIIARFGARPVFTAGTLALAIGVAGMGHVDTPVQAYAAFFVMGIGWACLSLAAVATTLAPWFEKHQGRAVSIASLGASFGGMTGVPILLFGIAHLGFAATTTTAAVVALLVLLPLSWFVIKRRPQDLGLLPDGAEGHHAARAASAPVVRWTRAEALWTVSLQSVMAGFGLAMLVQVGFITHQVTLLSGVLDAAGTSATVSATAVSALVSRLLLSRFADQIDARVTAALVLLCAALSLMVQALVPEPAVMVAASLLFGATIGNTTTLAPIIVRREFGAASFGAVFGVASCVIQLLTGLGPSFYGLLHDAYGGYGMPLMLAASLDLVACVLILSGRDRRYRSKRH
ncbi:MAG: MFS transporter [Proteobacteria bacterium]|nr:MFS transporter [Pseudomonadota bacterium]